MKFLFLLAMSRWAAARASQEDLQTDEDFVLDGAFMSSSNPDEAGGGHGGVHRSWAALASNAVARVSTAQQLQEAVMEVSMDDDP